MDIKAVIFDADGMVINSPGYFSVQYEKKFGVPQAVFLPFFKGKFQDCAVGKADLKEELKKVLDDWKWQGTVEELLDFWFKAEHYIDERMVKEIEKLREKGIICCLAAVQEKYRTEYIRKVMGFEKIFDKLYFSSEIGYKKPEKEFFQSIFDDLNKNGKIEPGEIMFWDDHQSNVDSAKELGWQGYFYCNFEEFQKKVQNL